jgi:hypothetical protein
VGSTQVINTAGAWVGAGLGVSSLAGTANQVNVSASTGAVTLSLPQNISTGAAVTFYSLLTSDAIQSNRATGPAIYAPNAYIQGKGLTSYGLAAHNSIQSDSGISCGTGTGGGFWVGSTQVINTAGVYMGSSGINCGITAGITGRAFNPYDGAGTLWTGQDLDPVMGMKVVGGAVVKSYITGFSGYYGGTTSGSFTIGGTNPPAGTYLVFFNIFGNSASMSLCLSFSDPGGAAAQCNISRSRDASNVDNAPGWGVSVVSTNGSAINFTLNVFTAGRAVAYLVRIA